MELKGIIGRAITEIIDKTSANCVLVLSKIDYPGADTVRIKANLMRKYDVGRDIDKKNFDFISTKLPPDSIAQVRKILIDIINRGGLEKGDKVFCVTDKTFGLGFDGLFLIFNIDERFMELSSANLDKEINKAVLDTIIDIAKEIAREGREGDTIGTSFLIGDHEKVLENSSQMILNPFEGHPLKDRNILDPQLRETVKNFAMLDGAFIIDDNGFVHAAGRYLSVDSSIVSLPGFGARHTSTAAMTKVTKSVGVVISQSGGRIRVFRDGNLIQEEKID